MSPMCSFDLGFSERNNIHFNGSQECSYLKRHVSCAEAKVSVARTSIRG